MLVKDYYHRDRPSQRSNKLLPCHVLHFLQLLFVVTHLEIQKQMPLSTITAMYIINRNLQNLHSRPLAILTELRNSNYMFFSSVNYILLYYIYTYRKICCRRGTPILKSSQIISPSSFLLFVITTYISIKMEIKCE